MIHKQQFLLLLLLLTSILISCDRTMVYDHFEQIENNSWKWEQNLDFTFDVEDTTSYHNILIQLRHSTDYPLSNLYMFASVNGPSGQSLQDTVQFILAEPDGNWKGKGLGQLREIAYLFRKNIRFPETGEYSIRLEQAMRLPEVPVTEIGIRVELN